MGLWFCFWQVVAKREPALAEDEDLLKAIQVQEATQV